MLFRSGDGPYGPPVRLDGRDRVVGAAVPWLRGESSSAGLFVFADGKANGPLISCRADGENGAGWEVFLEDGKLGLYIDDGTGRVKVRNVGLALPTGQWSHVLVAFDTASVRSRTVEVYVGGKMAVNSTVSAFLPTDIRPDVPLRLGARAAAPGEKPALLTGAGVWGQDFRVYTRGFQADDLKVFSAELEAMAALKVSPDKRTAAHKRQLRTHFLAAADLPSLALTRELDPFLAQEDALRARGGLTLVMEEKKDSEAFAHILNRGEYNQPGEKVPAAEIGRAHV